MSIHSLSSTSCGLSLVCTFPLDLLVAPAFLVEMFEKRKSCPLYALIPIQGCASSSAPDAEKRMSRILIIEPPKSESNERVDYAARRLVETRIRLRLRGAMRCEAQLSFETNVIGEECCGAFENRSHGRPDLSPYRQTEIKTAFFPKRSAEDCMSENND